MAETADQQRIIIKRPRKGGHGGHHGGAWKVAFADFMTAMMAFFLVMWLVGQKPEVKEAVQGYFRDPGKFQKQGASGVLSGSQGSIPSVEAAPPAPELQDQPNEKPGQSEQDALKLAAQRIIEELEQEEAFQRLKQNVKFELTSEGLRIILNESDDSPAFFEPGSAKLLQKSAIILVTIARELGRLQNRIVIEGHTSSGDTGNKLYTNWELSADRANAARQLMEVSGLYPKQVREVRGFADQFPMIKENPSDARNRRVTLVVLYKVRDKSPDQVEVGTDLMQEAQQQSTGG